MPKCKKSAGQAIDYACQLLPAEEADSFEEHLRNCKDCTEAFHSLSAVLKLTDAAQAEVILPDRVLEEIEMKVYKRLAATQEQTLLSRLRVHLANLGFLFRWQKTAAASTIAIAVLTVALFIENPFQSKAPFQLTEAQSADARIEAYRQQGIQRNLEEALITQHLRNDTWETESRLHRMKEQAQGTNWTKVAEEHLQSLQAGTLSVSSTPKGY